MKSLCELLTFLLDLPGTAAIAGTRASVSKQRPQACRYPQQPGHGAVINAATRSPAHFHLRFGRRATDVQRQAGAFRQLRQPQGHQRIACMKLEGFVSHKPAGKVCVRKQMHTPASKQHNTGKYRPTLAVEMAQPTRRQATAARSKNKTNPQQQLSLSSANPADLARQAWRLATAGGADYMQHRLQVDINAQKCKPG